MADREFADRELVDRGKVLELVECALRALDAVARELRAQAGLIGEEGGPAWEEGGRAGATATQREIAQRLRRFWAGVSMSPVLEVGGIRVDLRTAQGRWELMVFAVLTGARVREEVAVKTFRALRQKGLLRFEVLATDEDARAGVHEVFQRHYRALADRPAKADALVENARRLVDEWQGDLNNLYLASLKDGGLVRELQRFAQIDRMALWICRTLKVRGIWPAAPREDCLYVDRSVRLPLERLPLGYGGLEEERSRRALELIEELFEGDVLPLHLQGASLCAQDDVETCLGECPVAPWCRFPREARPKAGRKARRGPASSETSPGSSGFNGSSSSGGSSGFNGSSGPEGEGEGG